MVQSRVIGVTVVALAIVLLMPSIALAQAETAVIAGVVKDSSGAVLPGVTVEASSPALIEKVRSVVTNEQGQYRIIDLRPGAYVVTFTLPGFSTVRREGLQLTTGFTANVNADMAVGNLQETVTVTSQSPVVDIQNVRQQRVITTEVVDLLPTGRTNTGFAALVPGIMVQEAGVGFQDVGGLMVEGSRLVIHGGRSEDGARLINGLPTNHLSSSATSFLRPDSSAAEETSFQLASTPAEYRLGGVIINQIPKAGGNRFTGSVFYNYANSHFQSDNLDDRLRQSLGGSALNRMDHMFDWSASVGGPIKRDRLWFFHSTRYRVVDNTIAGNFYDSDLTDYIFTPDLNKQAHDADWNFHQVVNLTWQATPKNKIGVYVANQPRGGFSFPLGGDRTGRLTSPEAQRYQKVRTSLYSQIAWTAPVSNRLLVEGNVGIYRARVYSTGFPGVTGDRPSILDRGLNLAYNGPPNYNLPGYRTPVIVSTYKGAVSYVTGSHAFKTGIQWEHYVEGDLTTFVPGGNELGYTFLNGVPVSLTMNTTPRATKGGTPVPAMIGLFAQDQWTVRRLTLNPGLRLDYLHARGLPQSFPARPLVGPQDFPGIDNVPLWWDLSPRLGASYDLFGNGKTALKGSLSRYVVNVIQEILTPNTPANAVVTTATRPWTDDGDFIPECDLLNFAQNAECGKISNVNFGNSVITTRYDQDLLEGFGKRAVNWEASAGLQQELRPGVALNAAYFRRWFDNFTVTDDLSVTPADYDPYCITSPVDARLPGGGGQRLCGFYDVKPTKFGSPNNFVTFAKPFGQQTEVYDGVDLNVDARLAHGVLLQGGLSTGRTATNSCFVVDSPQAERPDFCNPPSPFLTQVKFLGTFNLPRGLQVSGTVQSIPGLPITAQYEMTSAQINSFLGRPPASGGTTTVDLLPSGTLFTDRLLQVDARAAKTFRVRRMRIRGMFDLYNALNANTVLSLNTTFGSAWQRPLWVLPGRLAKLAAQVDF